jgi:hypothetical protein
MWFRFEKSEFSYGLTLFKHDVEEVSDLQKWLIHDWDEFSDSSQSSIGWSAKWVATGVAGNMLIVLAGGHRHDGLGAKGEGRPPRGESKTN